MQDIVLYFSGLHCDRNRTSEEKERAGDLQQCHICQIWVGLKCVVNSVHTVLLAEHKQQLSSTVLQVCVDVGHEADQLASQCGVLLRSDGYVPQWG